MSARNVHTREPLIGRRREGRLRAQIEARLITLEGTIATLLADVSQWGARIEAADAPSLPLGPGQDAVVTWDRFEAFGTAVWTDGRTIGLLFDEALAREALIRTRAIADLRRLAPEQRQARAAAQAFVVGRWL